MSRDVINHIPVIVRQPAQTEVPGTGNFAANRSIDECMLANDTTVFQCNYEAAPDCEYSANTARSVLAHLRAHSPKIALRRVEAEKAKVERELAERKQRQSEGGKRAAQTRKANAEKSQPQSNAAVELLEIAKDLSSLGENIAEDLDALARRLQHLAKTAVDVDPIIAEKAAKFDAIRNTLA